ncbi:hypothetical protein JFV29_19175 [Peribacillus sp. TH16]|uniref:hypothetical protein n=1 Tax=Peribacillus sp. TH16 TaxID=2798482 RepID=UPI001912C35B|nr:hypothetical protein [Peribacillus sp. TH16]MBK5483964.1 hypothetical protein [Peribacillus sp. TH16]
MEALIILLFSLAIVILMISFFKQDKIAKLEEDLEQMTLTYMQDIYQLKKKVKILEEEFVIQDELINPESKFQHAVSTNELEPIHKILKSQVLSLYSQGLSLNQIAKQSSLTKEQTISVIEQHRLRGNEDE